MQRVQSTPTLGSGRNGEEEAVLTHFPPRYNIDGYLVPTGKGNGLKNGRERKQRFDGEDSTLHGPEDWERPVQHSTRTAMREKRHDEHVDELRRVQSAVQCRTIEELRSSKQVGDLLNGVAIRKEQGRCSSVLSGERRAQNLADLNSLVAKYTEPAQYAKEKLLSGDMPLDIPLEKRGHILSAGPSHANKLITRDIEPRQVGEHIDLKGDINRDKVNHPSLQWVEGTKTRGEVLHNRHEERAKERITYEQSYQGQRVRTRKQRAREIGPLSHMEEQVDRFAGRSMIEFNMDSHTNLPLVRRRELRESLEAAKEALDTTNSLSFQALVKPVVEGNQPWWDVHKSSDELQRQAQKLEQLEKLYARTRVDITEHPARSGEYRSERLGQLKDLRKVAKKITRMKKFDLQQNAVSRYYTPKHFTTTAIEFRNRTSTPELDLNGKLLGYTPGELQPLYSSFTPDQIFLEEEDRQKKNSEIRELEMQRKHGDKLPLRNYLIKRSPSKASLRPDSSFGDAISHGSLAKPANLLVGEHLFDGIRTSGFQNISM